MTSKRLHIIFVVVIVLLTLGLLGGAYGANKLLTTRANKLVALKAKSQALTQEQQSLKKAKQTIEKYAELEKIAQSIVPKDKSQAEAVRQIVNIASANEVSLSAITFPASTLGEGLTNKKSSSSSSSSSSAGTGRLSQLEPVKNIPGIYQLPITITGDPNKPVPYNKFISFLNALEHNRRTAQVGSITISPTVANRDYLTFTLTLNGYIKP